jgi:hypothetical protein
MEEWTFNGVPIAFDDDIAGIDKDTVYFLNVAVAATLCASRVVKNWRGRKFVLKPAARFVNLENGCISNG